MVAQFPIMSCLRAYLGSPSASRKAQMINSTSLLPLSSYSQGNGMGTSVVLDSKNEAEKNVSCFASPEDHLGLVLS